MKKLFILVALAFALTINNHSQAQNQQKKSSAAEMLINYEKQSWEGVKQKDYKIFYDRYAEDFYGNFPGSRGLTKTQLLEIFKTFDLTDYQLGNIKVTMLDKNSAILTYEVDEQVTGGGKKFLNHNLITSAWAKRGGKWLCVFFQPFIVKSTTAL
jgi:hypothetical protein